MTPGSTGAEDSTGTDGTSDTAMADEFDTAARWTAEAVAQLGPEHAVPAGCRGSGSPAALRWLADELGLGAGSLLLDSGAGVGGAAEFAVAEFGVDVVLAEPMRGACQAAVELFGRPTVAATGEALPLADGTVDAAWCLGVLCASDDQAGLLAELARVVRPGGAVGLLVYVRRAAELPEQPEGNDFPSDDRLAELVAGAGLTMRAQADLADFPDAPQEWTERADAVEDLVARTHAGDERWRSAAAQQEVMGKLIGAGQVVGTLVVATR